jgi:hypothetical protein
MAELLRLLAALPDSITPEVANVDTSLFNRFRNVIASASEADIRRDVTLGGKLALAREGALEISYAPFEHVVETARVVIVGITPGSQQAANALLEAQRQIHAGADGRKSLAAAKAYGSFSGTMRDSLVKMLDRAELHTVLGLTSCAEFWGRGHHLVHFTSALRNPVFVSNSNYNGSPSMTRTPLLRSVIETDLAAEVEALPNALWIPCGDKAAVGLEWLVKRGLLDSKKVGFGMPHPSPANAERIRYFLGIGRLRHELSSKTNPDRIDQEKAELMTKFAEFFGRREAFA